MIWTYFDRRTGRVLGQRRAATPPVLRGDRAAIAGEVPKGWHVDPETLEPAPCGDLQPIVAGNAIGNLPADCEILRDGKLLATGETSFAVEWDETVQLTLHAPRCNPLSVTLELKAGEPGDVKIEQDVRELRARAYPDIRDQLDAQWKGGAAAEDMKRRVLAVKARFPKTTKE